MDVKSVLIKLIDEEGLKSFILVDLLDGKLKAKLDELVLASDNKLDDSLVALIYPMLRDVADKFLAEQLGKLQA